MGEIRTYILEQSHYPYKHQEQQVQEAYDLLTLVNQSYQALEIGELNSIDDLRRAIEDVDSVKKLFIEKNSPSDTESLGLATTITYNEELETYVRMVSFFDKRKPEKGINWDLFTMEKGRLSIKSQEELDRDELQGSQREAINLLIDAIEAAEALGLKVFKNFDSPVIYKDQNGYHSKI